MNKYKNNYFGGPIRKSLLVILITWLIFGVFMYHKRSAQAENEPIVTDVVIENLSGF